MQPRTYYDKLKDPRWLVKRDEILKRDDNKCFNCSSIERLQVHHSYYERGLEPWQYPDHTPMTLCDYCHEQRHQQIIHLLSQISNMTQYELSCMRSIITTARYIGLDKVSSMLFKEQFGWSPADKIDQTRYNHTENAQ